MPCPFGFTAPPQEDSDVNGSDSGKRRKKEKDPRFDYSKDPVSWFFQNQIKSEEQFQENKAKLREQARATLEHLFDKKGKHLVIDSDDDFSICSSELSAWDSDVDSISSMVSCAADWVQETQFQAPALQQLKAVMLLTLVAAAFTGWHSLQAIVQINRFWGIISYGWVPAAALAGAVLGLGVTGAAWFTLGRLSKRHVLALQLAMQVVYAGAVMVALLCCTFPAQMDRTLRRDACGANSRDSKLCRYLPLIEEQVQGAMHWILAGACALAASTFCMSCCAVWYQWELGHVEKKAMKHKRRRKQHSKGIPWDRIKVEGKPQPVFMNIPRARGTETDKKDL